MLSQLAQDLLALGGLVHHAHKGGAQLNVGNILRHVAAHAAVDKLDAAGIAPGRQIQILGKTLHVHKYRAHNNDRHNAASCLYSIP